MTQTNDAACATSPPVQSAGTKAAAARREARLRSLRTIPVTVSVRIAEKTFECDSLLNLAPGSLLTFNKSCDELLDLYVNNRHYARGEAVKVGEKFGLRISQLGR